MKLTQGYPFPALGKEGELLLHSFIHLFTHSLVIMEHLLCSRLWKMFSEMPVVTQVNAERNPSWVPPVLSGGKIWLTI